MYNQTIEKLNALDTSPHWQNTEFVNDVLNDLPERMISVPYQIKKVAIRDAITSLKTGKKKVKQGKIERFSLSFRRRKSPVHSSFIPSSAIRSTGFYMRSLGVMRMSELLPVTPKDSRVLLDHGRWFLCVPEEIEANATETQGAVVAIDPGVRTFATIYGIHSGNEIVGKFGDLAQRRIFRLCLVADSIVNKLKTLPTRVRKTSLKRSLDRVKWRIRDLIAELHHQMARWLTDHFEMILLPTFETSQMVLKNSRKIRSKTVRQMLSLSHYRFAVHLESIAPGRVMRLSEAYTSKTNSWTGEIMNNLGGQKNFISDSIRIDRDINGARGIFLRALRDSSANSDELMR